MLLNIALVLLTLQPQASASLSNEKAFKCQRVLRAYCSAFQSITQKDDTIYFNLKSGEHVACDDKKNYDLLDPVQYGLRINNPDISSVIEWEYPFGKVDLPFTIEDGDPGRIRYEPLLMAIYGANESQVKKNLVKIDFLGQKINVNAKLGAADALSAISKDLQKIQGFQKRFWESREFSGSFNWRKVAGTNRLSVHSFGAAVDFTIKNDSSKKTYWLWVAKCIVPGCEKIEENLSVLPVDLESLDTFVIKNSGLTADEVVSVFEKHGYIWGGKWHHFDTMHFEFRPEFLDFHAQSPCALENDFEKVLQSLK